MASFNKASPKLAKSYAGTSINPFPNRVISWTEGIEKATAGSPESIASRRLFGIPSLKLGKAKISAVLK